MEFDPHNPNTKALVAFAQEVWGRYIRTHTNEEIAELTRRCEHNRLLRARMFGPPRPVGSGNKAAADGEARAARAHM